MFSEKTIAVEISGLMLDVGRRLDESLIQVKERCSKDEFESYRLVVGHLMGEMLLEVLNPIYSKYPDLKPPELE
jgi:hypothetical protein